MEPTDPSQEPGLLAVDRHPYTKIYCVLCILVARVAAIIDLDPLSGVVVLGSPSQSLSGCQQLESKRF